VKRKSTSEWKLRRRRGRRSPQKKKTSSRPAGGGKIPKGRGKKLLPFGGEGGSSTNLEVKDFLKKVMTNAGWGMAKRKACKRAKPLIRGVPLWQGSYERADRNVGKNCRHRKVPNVRPPIAKRKEDIKKKSGESSPRCHSKNLRCTGEEEKKTQAKKGKTLQ